MWAGRPITAAAIGRGTVILRPAAFNLIPL